jgi:hypothetical protein
MEQTRRDFLKSAGIVIAFAATRPAIKALEPKRRWWGGRRSPVVVETSRFSPINMLAGDSLEITWSLADGKPVQTMFHADRTMSVIGASLMSDRSVVLAEDHNVVMKRQ